MAGGVGGAGESPAPTRLSGIGFLEICAGQLIRFANSVYQFSGQFQMFKEIPKTQDVLAALPPAGTGQFPTAAGSRQAFKVHSVLNLIVIFGA